MMYVCPFCKLEIEDSIDSLIAHRAVGGVCDQRMVEIMAGKNLEKEGDT